MSSPTQVVLRFQIAIKMTTGFGNHLDATFDSRAQQPGTLVVTEGFAGDALLDPSMLSSMSWIRSKGERDAI
jgi:hypothetical protein